jgi:hypothetical protein
MNLEHWLAGVAMIAIAACGAHTAPSLAGTWTLVAADELRADGTRAPSYGAEPRGTLIIDDDGRYSLQIFRRERPRFASGNKAIGTADEYRAAVLGTSAHIGHCAIDPVAHTLNFQIDRASYPNWDGTEQRRQFTLVGDELSYQVPASAANNGTTPISVWRRVHR